MRVRQHMQGSYAHGTQPEQATVATTAELLALPWIASALVPGYDWVTTPEGTGWLLVLERDDHARWHVVARLDERPGLPAWNRSRAFAARSERGR